MKKKIILLTITLLSTYCFSQKYVDTLYNFKVDNGNIIWQKVFETKEFNPKKQFIKQTITNLKFNNLQEIDNSISFSVTEDYIDFKKYGGSAFTTTFHVQEPKEYLAVIDFKKNKYRVTIKQITVDYINSFKHKSPLSDVIIKKKKIRNNKRNKKDLNYYQKHFIEQFTIKAKKDDW